IEGAHWRRDHLDPERVYAHSGLHGQPRSAEKRALGASWTRYGPRRGRNTHRGAETPRETRSCLSARVSLLARPSAPRSPCRGRRPHARVVRGDLWHESGPRQPRDRLGFLAVPRLWGLPDSPQAQAVGFPTHTHRYSESPYGSSPARFPASICSAAWDQLRT